MDFVLMSCPYCGGAVDSTDEEYATCKGCGRKIYTDRTNVRAFTADSVLEDILNTIIDYISDDNMPKAMALADEVVEDTQEQDHDALFLRGAINALTGEDGKAMADWKKGLEMISAFTEVDVDAYVCLFTESVSELIYYKEREFIEFDPIKYVDRLCELFTEATGLSCKAYIFYNIYRVYREKMEFLKEDGDDVFMDVIPGMFRRIIEYHKDYRSLIRIIDEYLENEEYNEETYEDDDAYECHLYNLVKIYFEVYTAEMSDDELAEVYNHWNDTNMKALEDHFEEIHSCIEDTSMLGRLRRFRGESDVCDLNISDAVNDFVKRDLLMIHEESEEPKVL